MIKVFYYYYFLFYSRVLKDNEPHLLTTLALSASEGFLINGILQISLARFFCISIDKWPMIGILVLLIGANYLYYHRTGKAKEIVKTKPMFYSNRELSVTLTLLFFIVTLSFLFWEPIYIKQIMEEYCR
jgi:uncharacterized membrane protein